MTTKPTDIIDGFCDLHRRGLQVLTAEWKSLSDLKKETDLGNQTYTVLSDLAEWKLAEVKQEDIIIQGIQCGCNLYYRYNDILKQSTGAFKDEKFDN